MLWENRCKQLCSVFLKTRTPLLKHPYKQLMLRHNKV